MAEPETTTEPTEEWRPVVGWEDWYSVSSLGRVRRDRRGKSTYIGRICIPHFTLDGYMKVRLTRDCKSKGFLISRLVGFAFVPGYQPGLKINHKSGIKTDNTPSNLEWVTDSENLRHAIHNGLRPWPRGGRNGHSKLTESDIPQIRALLAFGMSQDEIGRLYGVCQVLISLIKRGKNWTHV